MLFGAGFLTFFYKSPLATNTYKLWDTAPLETQYPQDLNPTSCETKSHQLKDSA